MFYIVIVELCFFGGLMLSRIVWLIGSSVVFIIFWSRWKVMSWLRLVVILYSMEVSVKLISEFIIISLWLKCLVS